MARPRPARIVFATNVRQARKALGISQEQLAELANLHRTYVGSVERGERNISINNIEALAKALKKTCAEMLSPSAVVQPSNRH